MKDIGVEMGMMNKTELDYAAMGVLFDPSVLRS